MTTYAIMVNHSISPPFARPKVQFRYLLIICIFLRNLKMVRSHFIVDFSATFWIFAILMENLLPSSIDNVNDSEMKTSCFDWFYLFTATHNARPTDIFYDWKCCSFSIFYLLCILFDRCLVLFFSFDLSSMMSLWAYEILSFARPVGHCKSICLLFFFSFVYHRDMFSFRHST